MDQRHRQAETMPVAAVNALAQFGDPLLFPVPVVYQEDPDLDQLAFLGLASIAARPADLSPFPDVDVEVHLGY